MLIAAFLIGLSPHLQKNKKTENPFSYERDSNQTVIPSSACYFPLHGSHMLTPMSSLKILVSPCQRLSCSLPGTERTGPAWGSAFSPQCHNLFLLLSGRRWWRWMACGRHAVNMWVYQQAGQPGGRVNKRLTIFCTSNVNRAFVNVPCAPTLLYHSGDCTYEMSWSPGEDDTVELTSQCSPS